MAASAYLTQNGYQVDVFEKNDRAGGLMIYGIPNFKLDKKIVERRTEWLLESGVKFNLNMEVGKNISFHDLEKDYDAILIATGVYKARQLDIDTSSVNNSIPALDFLIESNRTGLGDSPSKNLYLTAKNEAKKFFGNDELYIEKYFKNPRHIEVQIMSGKNRTVHLGERDCSVQRRHQKLIEETPSPVLTEDQRKYLLKKTVEMVEKINYEGA